MKRKGKRTRGIEEAHPFSSLSRVNLHAAGVDIGAIEIVACVAGDENTQIVKAFGNYTVDLQALAQWMKAHYVKTVAMESTGVYWIHCSRNWNARALSACSHLHRTQVQVLVRVRCGEYRAERATSVMRNGSRPCTAMDCWKAPFARRRSW
jgi:hypothetical protein